jgi:AcrR family transcriptional regulator
MSATSSSETRHRVPASERRDALIDAAIHEFAFGGLHGTPVSKIAQQVGVAQPYVFSLFPGKKELFMAAVERSFERTTEMFRKTAAAFDPATAEPEVDVLKAMGMAYVAMLESNRDALMFQHQSYAACNDPEIRDLVRGCYARLVHEVQELSGADAERIDDFMRHGMALNVAAAMGVEDLSVGCQWVLAELASDEPAND